MRKKYAQKEKYSRRDRAEDSAWSGAGGRCCIGIGAGYHKLDEMEKRITALEEAQAVQQGDIKDAGGRVETLEKRTRSLARSVKKLETGTLSVSAEEGTLSPPSGNAEGAIDWTSGERSGEVPSMTPGEILDAEMVRQNPASYFQSFEIPYGGEIYERINGRSYRENNDISLSELRYLLMPHYNFEHQVQVGEMIVNAAIAQDVLGVFRELFAGEYEINSMYLVDNYWTGDGDSTDTASIEVNNTSCFNYRNATGSSTLSNHGLGRAIDINPQQNPYIWLDGDGWTWYHRNADPYVDRESGDPHVIVPGDLCYNTFTKYGFSWGGNWSNPIDYQHFEK